MKAELECSTSWGGKENNLLWGENTLFYNGQGQLCLCVCVFFSEWGRGHIRFHSVSLLPPMLHSIQESKIVPSAKQSRGYECTAEYRRWCLLWFGVFLRAQPHILLQLMNWVWYTGWRLVSLLGISSISTQMQVSGQWSSEETIIHLLQSKQQTGTPQEDRHVLFFLCNCCFCVRFPWWLWGCCSQKDAFSVIEICSLKGITEAFQLKHCKCHCGANREN